MQVTGEKGRRRIVMDAWANGHDHPREDAENGPGVRSTIMPIESQLCDLSLGILNFKVPVDTAERTLVVAEQIQNCVPKEISFQFLPVPMITENTTPKTIKSLKHHGITRVKMMLKDVSVNSHWGVPSLRAANDVYAACQDEQVTVLHHGESNNWKTRSLDREFEFLSELAWVLDRFPRGRYTVEHMTDARTVMFVRSARQDGYWILGLIAPQYTVLTHDHIYGYTPEPDYPSDQGFLHTHWYSKPIAKWEEDRAALVEAMLSGQVCFALGFDNAAHPKTKKEAACCSAGAWNLYATPGIIVEQFDRAGKLEGQPHLENIASRNLRAFYGLPEASRQIQILEMPYVVPRAVPLPDGDEIVSFYGGRTLKWGYPIW